MAQLTTANTDLKKEIREVRRENEELQHNIDSMQNDLSSFAETFRNLQTENESLQQQLDQKYHAMDEHENSPRSHAMSPTLTGLNRQDSRSIVSETNLDSLAAELDPDSLEAQGYAASYTQYDALEAQVIDAPSNGMMSQNASAQFRNTTIDAQEEFYRLVCARRISAIFALKSAQNTHFRLSLREKSNLLMFQFRRLHCWRKSKGTMWHSMKLVNGLISICPKNVRISTNCDYKMKSDLE